MLFFEVHEEFAAFERAFWQTTKIDASFPHVLGGLILAAQIGQIGENQP